MNRLRLLVGAVALFAFALLALALRALGLRRAAPEEPATRRVRAGDGTRCERAQARRSEREKPRRLLLDAPALARLQESARAKTPAFGYVLARAGEVAEKTVESGYQGFEWADAVANASLAWHATGDARYADAALATFARCSTIVSSSATARVETTWSRYDSGYGIRTFAAYAALGYDWLRGAPGMDAALRARILERLEAWLGWYEKSGYLRDRPTANYYWGYLTALSFAGLAASGESAAADRWLKLARDELSTSVLPAFREELRGGGWPEGWQYGEYTDASKSRSSPKRSEPAPEST